MIFCFFYAVVFKLFSKLKNLKHLCFFKLKCFLLLLVTGFMILLLLVKLFWSGSFSNYVILLLLDSLKHLCFNKLKCFLLLFSRIYDSASSSSQIIFVWFLKFVSLTLVLSACSLVLFCFH